jgi:hypothetical protein
MLPDRVLPSFTTLALGSPARFDYSLYWAEPDVEQMRFAEDPKSGELRRYWESGIFSLSAKDTATQFGPGGLLGIAGPQPAEALPFSGTTAPSLALFLAGWADGTQIAGDLSPQSADDVGTNATAEVAVQARGNTADMLLTVDTVLPDAMADLVRLQNADLAIVPTYVVGAAPASPLAPPRADDRPDLGLTVQVIGLDEFPGGASLTPAATDLVFEEFARFDGGRGVAPGHDNLEGMQSSAIYVANAAPAQAQQFVVSTDVAAALGQWLDGFSQEGEMGAVTVSVFALTGLVAFVCWRRAASNVQRNRPGGSSAHPEPVIPGQ